MTLEPQTITETMDRVRKALKFYEKYSTKRSNRQAKSPSVRNYKLNLSVANQFITEFPDILGQKELKEDHFELARSEFYKDLNAILHILGLKARRNGCVGYLDGSEQNIQRFLRLIAADGTAGNVTNISLHNYMSDLTFPEYYHLIKNLYDTQWNEDFDQYKMTNFVLQSLLQSCETDQTFTIFGEEYTLDKIPLEYIMILTRLPIDTTVQSGRILTGMTPLISQHFVTKMATKIKNAHLLAYLDVSDIKDIKVKGSIPAHFDTDSRILTTSTTGDQDIKMHLYGFTFNTRYSFSKTIRGNEEISIPDDIHYLFIACKKSSECLCNK